MSSCEDRSSTGSPPDYTFFADAAEYPHSVHRPLVPSVVVLPENNKTTAKADSEACSVAFILPLLEEFGCKPPPSAYSALHFSGRGDAEAPRREARKAASGLCYSNGASPRLPAVPSENEPFVGELKDGGVRTLQKLGKELILQDGLEDNFYVLDLGRLALLYRAFQAAMPRVHPFYAMKCNPDPGFVKQLADMGAGFDCASAREMADVLALGGSAERIIFAHPCKRPACLKYAVKHNVRHMTFDSLDELEKIALAAPGAQLVLRIKADDPSAVVQFGHKYGAHPTLEAPALLDAASRAGMAVVGVSFHVGSGSQSADSYGAAIAAARSLFDAGAARGLDMKLLDIGGGFFGRFDAEGHVVLDGVAAAVNTALAEHFPPACGVKVIAEPGRYFAEACATLFCMVHTVKETVDAASGAAVARSYFITDGVYGSFNGLIYDHGSVTSLVMRDPRQAVPSAAQTGTRLPSTVFGPTCDGIDLIYKGVPMPLLRRGDWLQFPNFGAYSVAGACPFNGLNVDAPSKYYTWSHAPVARDESDGIVQSHRGAVDPAILTAPEDRLCYYGVLSDLDIL